MATLQKDGLMIGKDTSGNTVIVYPITTMDNVDGLPEALAASKPVVQLSTLSAAGWAAGTKTYSFEAGYPAAQYDVSIEPDSSCTDAQLEVWDAARIIGSASSNVITARGEVPTVNIPIIMEVREK